MDNLLPLKASSALGAVFLSGWSFNAAFLYAFFISAGDAPFSRPSTL